MAGTRGVVGLVQAGVGSNGPHFDDVRVGIVSEGRN